MIICLYYIQYFYDVLMIHCWEDTDLSQNWTFSFCSAYSLFLVYFKSYFFVCLFVDCDTDWCVCALSDYFTYYEFLFEGSCQVDNKGSIIIMGLLLFDLIIKPWQKFVRLILIIKKLHKPNYILIAKLLAIIIIFITFFVLKQSINHILIE